MNTTDRVQVTSSTSVPETACAHRTLAIADLLTQLGNPVEISFA